MRIQPYEDAEREAVVRLSLRAWAPVFESIKRAMDPEVYREQVPDWRVTQRDEVQAACADEDMHVRLAVEDDVTVGFVALRLHTKDRMGEIHMIAVDPDYQRRGIATALMHYSLDWFKNAGMTTVMVETGGDPGHAPARSAYEALGFRILPIARYFKKL